MCADKGHYDRGWRSGMFLRSPVGVMCADKGHYDLGVNTWGAERHVGVMCADKGHYDSAKNPLKPKLELS